MHCSLHIPALLVYIFFHNLLNSKLFCRNSAGIVGGIFMVHFYFEDEKIHVFSCCFRDGLRPNVGNIHFLLSLIASHDGGD